MITLMMLKLCSTLLMVWYGAANVTTRHMKLGIGKALHFTQHQKGNATSGSLWMVCICCAHSDSDQSLFFSYTFLVGVLVLFWVCLVLSKHLPPCKTKKGPCGVLASIQAVLIKELMWPSSSLYPATHPCSCSHDAAVHALSQALSLTLWRAQAAYPSDAPNVSLVLRQAFDPLVVNKFLCCFVCLFLFLCEVLE